MNISLPVPRIHDSLPPGRTEGEVSIDRRNEMNERTRELAIQVDLMRYPSDSINIKIEKFAELIVRECAEVAGCNAHVSGFMLGDLIKEHFGVEND
jgi:hypothetical protein